MPLPPIPDLVRQLKTRVLAIPPGRVATYGALAASLGDVRAAKWVASFLCGSPQAANWPWHRVVLRTGEIGPAPDRDVAGKIRRIRSERIVVRNGAIDLARFGFDDFKSSASLARLRRFQEDALAKVSIQPLDKSLQTVAGVDLSYASPRQATAGYVLFDYRSQHVLSTCTLSAPVKFPYIAGYLAFRELPLLLALLQRVREKGQLADVILVDGHGQLHPRHVGLATHLGIEANIPTIGVGKKLLCGTCDRQNFRVGEARPVVHAGQTVAMALQSTPQGGPIYVSAGHRADLASAVELVRTLLGGHKLPGPTHAAHAVSRNAARHIAMRSNG